MSSSPSTWVVGDAMADVTVTAAQFRKTPEDPTVTVFPVPSPDSPGIQLSPGGAANVAANLRAMGCDVSLLAVIGSEGFGVTLTDQLTAAGVKVSPHLTADRRPKVTTAKVRFVEGGKLAGRVDFDHDAPAPILPPAVDPAVLPLAVVLADHGRGVITPDSARAWVRWAHSRGVTVYADPKAGRQHVWDGTPVDVMCANWLEACGSRAGIHDIDPADDGWAKALASSVRSAWGPFRTSIVKRGPFGSAWATNGDNGLQAGVQAAINPQQVFDVQGAGDTFLAGLVTARCRGAGLADACLFAAAAAGVAVGRPGTAIVSAADVAKALLPVVAAPRGVITQDEAIALAARFRRLGLTTSLTSGCFQLLTPGHVATLRAAAKTADFLFAAVDSDAKVRALKGPGTPVTTEADRVNVVSGVAGVGAAFTFNTPLGAVVQVMKPDVLCKADEYTVDKIDGASYLSKWGARVELVPTVEGLHNSELIARIRKG